MPQYPSAGSTFDPIWHDPLQAMSAFAHRSRESKTIHFPRFLSLLGGGASRSWASCEAAGLARGDEVMASRQHKPLLVGGISTAALVGGESQISAHRRLEERGSRRRRSSSAKELSSRLRPVRRSRGGARGSTVGNHTGIGWFSGIGSASEGPKYSLVGRKNWACENIGHLFGQLLELCFACACPKLIFWE